MGSPNHDFIQWQSSEPASPHEPKNTLSLAPSKDKKGGNTAGGEFDYETMKWIEPTQPSTQEALKSWPSVCRPEHNKNLLQRSEKDFTDWGGYLGLCTDKDLKRIAKEMDTNFKYHPKRHQSSIDVMLTVTKRAFGSGDEDLIESARGEVWMVASNHQWDGVKTYPWREYAIAQARDAFEIATRDASQQEVFDCTRSLRVVETGTEDAAKVGLAYLLEASTNPDD